MFPKCNPYIHTCIMYKCLLCKSKKVFSITPSPVGSTPDMMHDIYMELHCFFVGVAVWRESHVSHVPSF